jgi:hypothetical protein
MDTSGSIRFMFTLTEIYNFLSLCAQKQRLLVKSCVPVMTGITLYYITLQIVFHKPAIFNNLMNVSNISH